MKTIFFSGARFLPQAAAQVKIPVAGTKIYTYEKE